MRTGGAAVVKNEADIIEAFVRHNLGYLDELHVVDNGSTDGTWEILQALAAEAPRLRVGQDFRTDHPQEHLMSALLAEWPEPRPDWVFCLDADELISAGSRAAFDAAVGSWSGAECVTLWWDFYVPTAADDAAEPNPIRRITRRRADQPADGMLTKVVVPKRFLGQPELRVRAGNHFLSQRNGVVLPHPIVSEPRLAHFPIRSSDQVAKKAVVGAWAVSSRATRDPHEASHWEDLKDRVLSGEVLPEAELADLAYNYAASDRLPRVEPADFVLAEAPLATSVEDLTATVGSSPRGFLTDALGFADAHFRNLRRVAVHTDEVEVLKARRGLVAVTRATPAEQAQALREAADWQRGEIDFCVDAVVGGDTVWDLGAGIGYQTVAFARRVGAAGTVVAAEADADLRQDLAANLTLNGLRNVTIVGSAAEALARLVPESPRPSRWRRRKSDSGEAAQHPAAPPSLVRIGGGGFPVLAQLADEVLTAGPTVFLCEVGQCRPVALMDWADAHDYGWYWYFSAGSPGSEDPRVALVGVPGDRPPPPGLQRLDPADSDWRAAFARQERKPNTVGDRWAFSRHGLEERWH
ncbi:MAG: glycosyltransferase family 2 protein [Actinobacteria bacterium]|nr:glycosyltransferase family 2 protein [Actinomycetota bacterium]